MACDSSMQFGFNITAAVLFSAWLDLTDSNPTYDSNRHCTGDCYGIGDSSFTGNPGINRLHAMCASRPYAGDLPINMPTLSPLQAPLDLLGRLPPMMLVIGSAEVLLGDNLQFVQMVARAGGSAQLEVSILFGRKMDFICTLLTKCLRWLVGVRRHVARLRDVERGLRLREKPFRGGQCDP